MRSRLQIWLFRVAALGVVGFFFVWPLTASIIVLAWITYVVASAYWYQSFQGARIERALGFTHGKLYHRGTLESALAVTSVVEGGIFAKAGFQPDDVLPDWSITGFFRFLHRSRGQFIALEVVDGDLDGPPFRSRPRKTLCIAIPTTFDAQPTANLSGPRTHDTA